MRWHVKSFVPRPCGLHVMSKDPICVCHKDRTSRIVPFLPSVSILLVRIQAPQQLNTPVVSPASTKEYS